MNSTAPFYILGPTAVGKSELAVEVAERCGAEIVSADAYQVYQGLDILTAKPSPALRARVPHYLIGEVPLTEHWDVAKWLGAARPRIAEIHARNRRVIVAGGTGLYIRALTRGLADLPAASPELRAELEAQPLRSLQEQLAQLDPDSAQNIDLQNARRVVRALEVCLLTGRPFSSFRTQWKTAIPGVRGIILLRDREDLCARIDQRTEAMFAAGVLDEVRALGEVGPTACQTLGLRELRAHLSGEISRSECVAAIQQATRQYAKRQLTWFRRENAFRAIHMSGLPDHLTLLEEIAREATAE